VALAALSWGTTGTTLVLIGATAPSAALLVGAIRMAIAGPLLLAAMLVRRERPRASGWAVVPAGLCMAAYQVCYFSAVPLAGVVATALLAICSAPIIVAVLAYFWLGERLTPVRVLALALGLGGAALLLAGRGAEVGPHAGVGALLALGAGLAYSIYAVITKRALSGSEPLNLSALTFGLAAVPGRHRHGSRLLAVRDGPTRHSGWRGDHCRAAGAAHGCAAGAAAVPRAPGRGQRCWRRVAAGGCDAVRADAEWRAGYSQRRPYSRMLSMRVSRARPFSVSEYSTRGGISA